MTDDQAVRDRLKAIDQAVLINVLTKAKAGDSLSPSDWREARRVARSLGLTEEDAVSKDANRERRPATRFPRDTLGDMAEALGIHRNTATAWSSAGAPGGPPYCEMAWRTWAAAQGKTVPKQPEQSLLELLANAGVADYRRLLEQQRGAASSASPPSNGTIPTDWAQENKRLDALSKQADYDLKMRRLIDRETLLRLVEGIATVGARIFDDAPGLVDALPLAPDDKARVRAAVAEQLKRRRAQLVDGINAALTEFLEHPPT